jgi:ribosome-associated protein
MNLNRIITELLNQANIKFIRSPGPGGQNVNKVSTGVHLRIDINEVSIPEYAKIKIRNFNDSHITENGLINIKSHSFRTQEKNKTEAFRRLRNLLNKAFAKKKKRLKTKPTLAAKRRRLENKHKRSEIKKTRSKNFPD